MVAWLGAIAGCAKPSVPLWGPPQAAADYGDQIDVWTRRGETYKDFESRLFAYATYRAWPFRQAQIAHRERTERLPKLDVKALVAREKEAHQGAHQFFFAAHTHEWAWNHFERVDGDDALWKLRLLNDAGDSVAPIAVKRLGTKNGRYTALYPYYEGFYVGYLVSFPRSIASGKALFRRDMTRFLLRISGPQAALDLVWTVRQEPPAR